MNGHDLPADLIPTKCYTSLGRIYVPDYHVKGAWRGPCGLTYNEATLKTYATPCALMLWKRGVNT